MVAAVVVAASAVLEGMTEEEALAMVVDLPKGMTLMQAKEAAMCHHHHIHHTLLLKKEPRGKVEVVEEVVAAGEAGLEVAVTAVLAGAEEVVAEVSSFRLKCKDSAAAMVGWAGSEVAGSEVAGSVVDSAAGSAEKVEIGTAARSPRLVTSARILSQIEGCCCPARPLQFQISQPTGHPRNLHRCQHSVFSE